MAPKEAPRRGEKEKAFFNAACTLAGFDDELATSDVLAAYAAASIQRPYSKAARHSPPAFLGAPLLPCLPLLPSSTPAYGKLVLTR